MTSKAGTSWWKTNLLFRVQKLSYQSFSLKIITCTSLKRMFFYRDNSIKKSNWSLAGEEAKSWPFQATLIVDSLIQLSYTVFFCTRCFALWHLVWNTTNNVIASKYNRIISPVIFGQTYIRARQWCHVVSDYHDFQCQRISLIIWASSRQNLSSGFPTR